MVLKRTLLVGGLSGQEYSGFVDFPIKTEINEEVNKTVKHNNPFDQRYLQKVERVEHDKSLHRCSEPVKHSEIKNQFKQENKEVTKDNNPFDQRYVETDYHLKIKIEEEQVPSDTLFNDLFKEEKLISFEEYDIKHEIQETSEDLHDDNYLEDGDFKTFSDYEFKKEIKNEPNSTRNNYSSFGQHYVETNVECEFKKENPTDTSNDDNCSSTTKKRIFEKGIGGTNEQCRLCLKNFENPSDFLNHLVDCSSSHKRRKLEKEFGGSNEQCKICLKNFKMPSDFLNHLIDCSSSNKRRKLLEESLKERKEHRTNKKNKSRGRKEQCKICLKNFATPSDVLSHLRNNCSSTNKRRELVNESRRRKEQCKICLKDFKKPSDVLTHLIDNCSSSNKRKLEKEVRGRREQCKICLKNFKTQSDVLNHLRITKAHHVTRLNNIHLNYFVRNLPLSTNAPLPQEGKELLNWIERLESCGLTEEHPSFYCEVCEKHFTDNEGLETHAEIIHYIQFSKSNIQCRVCMAKFTSNVAHFHKHSKYVKRNGAKVNVDEHQRESERCLSKNKSNCQEEEEIKRRPSSIKNKEVNKPDTKPSKWRRQSMMDLDGIDQDDDQNSFNGSQRRSRGNNAGSSSNFVHPANKQELIMRGDQENTVEKEKVKPIKRSPDDWACPNPSCEIFNPSWRQACEKCSAPKPGEGNKFHAASDVAAKPPFALGSQAQCLDWTCPTCGNGNFGWRIRCKWCECTRPESIDDTIKKQVLGQKNEGSFDDQDDNRAACNDFKNGDCTRPNCKFSHKPHNTDNAPICLDFQTGECTRRNCKFGHRIAGGNEQDFRPVCNDFKNGDCSRQNCRFSHNFPGQIDDQEDNRPICLDFQNGDCSGQNCKFSHEVPGQTGRPCNDFQTGDCTRRNCKFSHKITGGNEEDVRPMCNDFKNGDCSRQNCRFSHNFPGQIDDQEDNRPICLDFQNGDCSRQNCKFSHRYPTATDKNGEIRPLCKDFQTGKCFRHNCKFSHDIPKLQVCGDFQSGNCSRGDRCRFAHRIQKKQVCKDFTMGRCSRTEEQCRFIHGHPTIPDPKAPKPSLGGSAPQGPAGWDQSAGGLQHNAFTPIWPAVPTQERKQAQEQENPALAGGTPSWPPALFPGAGWAKYCQETWDYYAKYNVNPANNDNGQRAGWGGY